MLCSSSNKKEEGRAFFGASPSFFRMLSNLMVWIDRMIFSRKMLCKFIFFFSVSYSGPMEKHDHDDAPR